MKFVNPEIKAFEIVTEVITAFELESGETQPNEGA